MRRFSIRSAFKTAVASSLILALLVRVPFADGLLLHDHNDQGIHSHAVALDDLRGGDLRAALHRYHDDIHNVDHHIRNNDSDGGECTGLLLIFANAPATARGIRCTSDAEIASIQHLCSKVLPRSILPSDPTDTFRLFAAASPWGHPLRPVSAIDALLQSSHALLL